MRRRVRAIKPGLVQALHLNLRQKQIPHPSARRRDSGWQHLLAPQGWRDDTAGHGAQRAAPLRWLGFARDAAL